MIKKSIADQNFEAITQRKGRQSGIRSLRSGLAAGELKKKKWLFLLIVPGLLVLTILILFFRRVPPASQEAESVTPTPAITSWWESEQNLSRYATDSAILKIQEDIKVIESKLQATDLNETGLNPPVLKWDLELE